MPAPERIVLVGFMGAGKSTVGPLVANRMKWSFQDLDDVIEATVGRSVPELLTEGEDAFRRLESDIGARCLEQSRLVLAVGGGWPLQLGHMDRLGAGCVAVWLKVSPGVAIARIRSSPACRPLLEGGDWESRARRLLAARNPHYALSSIRIETDKRRPEDVASEVVERVEALSLPSVVDLKQQD